jgi:putative aminopeptidase FrvX
MNTRHRSQLIELLKQPTAPFREEHVIASVERLLEGSQVPFFRDPVGNVIVGCASHAQYRRLVREKTAEPLRVFIAHMDHPGFHGVRWISKTRLKVKWHGGSPVRHLNGSRVWLASHQGHSMAGKLGRVQLVKSKNSMDTAEVQITGPTTNPRPKADQLYGGFKFRAPVWRSGMKIYAKAADDLVGVFAVVDTAIWLHTKHRGRKVAPFIGLLTRAEEVGFIGAIGHFELGWLGKARRPLICISLETSRTLPGAVVGNGPVVRLGDRRTVFDPAYLEVLTGLARKVLPKRHQRRIMDGGTCEATAAIAYGFPAVGLSVPLGNYHNEGFEGGPDCRAARGPAPEFVHLHDIDGMRKLCRALMLGGLPWQMPWRQPRQQLRRRLRGHRRLL